MTVSLIVGTAKGAAVARSDAKRERWQVDALAVKGWIVTAATRDAGGRYYLGVASEVYGAAIVASDDLKTFEQLDAAPRYAATDVGNADHNHLELGKAGRRRWLGIRPTVRGVAMNPIDHPHGGGEGRSSGGRHPVTPWGKPTKGYRTRRNKRTEPMRVRRRT